MEISQQTARKIHLDAQGLLVPRSQPASKGDLLATIRQMGALQIDTINVVARSPYLVLWSRLGPYLPAWLEELEAEGHLFEYWAHAACFLPIEDYRLFRGWMREGRRVWMNAFQWIQDHPDISETILGTIREKGPVRSSDFERRDGRHSGWWNWKEEKIALEMLFTSGQLMIARRKNFQRIYDLTERVHPTWRDENTPSSDEVLRSLVLQTVKSLGITRPEWVADYYRIPKADARRVIAGLLAEGSLVETQVEGWMAPPCLMIPRAGDPTSPPGAGLPEPTLTTLLSPFDPVIWDRTRVKAMFDFDYTIECYLPEAKRRYGYFTLPILHRGRLVGRLDPKAHRKDGIFEVKKLILEAGIQPEADLAKDIAQAIQNCAGWHQTPRVKLGATEPAEFARLLEEALP